MLQGFNWETFCTGAFICAGQTVALYYNGEVRVCGQETEIQTSYKNGVLFSPLYPTIFEQHFIITEKFHCDSIGKLIGPWEIRMRF